MHLRHRAPAMSKEADYILESLYYSQVNKMLMYKCQTRHDLGNKTVSQKQGNESPTSIG